MAILKPDPFLPMYVYEKEINPNSVILMRQFQKQVVDAVDRIVELAHGQRDFIKTESDWKVVEEMLGFWAKQWPEEYMEFRAAVVDIRETRNKGGYSSTKEIKYVGALPSLRFQRMLKAVFPAQQWDKKFSNKFVKKFPLFKVGNAVT